MHYAISHQSFEFPFLSTTPRKKVLKHSLICVKQGVMLVRLGKQEYAVEAGDDFWIPFDCLCALTFFPQTVIERVDFSVRLTNAFPSKAGYVEHTNLSTALIERLSKDTKMKDAVKDSMLDLVKHEVTNMQPLLLQTERSQQFTQWSPNDDADLPKDELLVMTMREARKRLLSGTSEDAMIEELFDGRDEEYHLLKQIVFGSDSLT